jgi:hypothetical protein
MAIFWRTVFLIIFSSSALWVSGQSKDQANRDAFIVAQNSYLALLDLNFYQNKEYQIITRNADKEEMRVMLSDMPDNMRKSKIKKIRKVKNKQMKSLLSPAQYRRYISRQKEIDRTLSKDW